MTDEIRVGHIDVAIDAGPDGGDGLYIGVGSWAAWHEPLRVTRWVAMDPGGDGGHPAGHDHPHARDTDPANGEADRGSIREQDADPAMQRIDDRNVRQVFPDSHPHPAASEHSGTDAGPMQHPEQRAVLPAGER